MASPIAKERPRVSVVIPCFEAGHLVADAVASVLAQEEPRVEIVVVDDGSSDPDAAGAALARFGDAVTLLRQTHAGLSAARNRGLAAAGADLVAFLDADDAWKPGFLRRQLAFLEEADADLVYCDAEAFGPLVSGPMTVMGVSPSTGEPTLGAVLAGRCTVVMSTVVARTHRVRAAGGFDEGMAFCEDFELWVRMLGQGCRFAYHTESLTLRRVHPGNMSRNRRGMLEGVLRVLERHAPEASLDPIDRAAVMRRLADTRVRHRIDTAKAAIAAGDASGARRALWAAVRMRPAWKTLAVALGLTLAPGPSMRLLRDREP